MSKKITTQVFMALTFAAVSFCYGVAVGHYNIPPYSVLRAVKTIFIPTREYPDEEDNVDYASNDGERLRGSFPYPLPKVRRLRNPPALSLPILKEQLAEWRTIRVPEFFSVYNKLSVEQPVSIGNNIRELPYQINQIRATAFAWVIASRSEQPSDCAILIIPGSGQHQVSAIVTGEEYHGSIAADLSARCDVYVLIKPGHDYRSIHNGIGTLSYDYFFVGMLNDEYSYSVTYLTEALAWIKYLSDNYQLSGVAGLSQGGAAALLVSLQSNPDFTIVASGFSLYLIELQRGSFNQIIIPGMFQVYDPENIKSIIENQETRYLFSWGRRERWSYKLEADTRRSCNFLKRADPTRIQCVIHNAGHTFPTPEILAFIDAVAGKNPE